MSEQNETDTALFFQQIELMMVNSALSGSFFVGDREQQSRLIGNASDKNSSTELLHCGFLSSWGLDNLQLRREGEGEYTADRCVNPS